MKYLCHICQLAGFVAAAAVSRSNPGGCWSLIVLLATSCLVVPAAAAQTESFFDPLEATIPELQAALASGRITSRELTDYYLGRIQDYDDRGPALNAMAKLNPEARRRADALDQERFETGSRGWLHGIPLVVKDNYETVGMPTTVGSELFADFQPEHDAHAVARLKAAGAIVLGKTNMHEFAFGITTQGSGFGATRNPYDPTRNPGGSSGGTAAAVAANFAAAGMGSDTCGSIRFPAAHTSLVGLRGTQGLSSRQGLVPLSHTQDIGGPLGRSVIDVAILLDATVGFDREDPQTAASVGNIPPSYLSRLSPAGLQGKRIGILEDLLIVDPEDAEVVSVIGRASAELRGLGAELARVRIPALWSLLSTRIDGFFVLVYDFKHDFNRYLAAHPDAPVRTLEDVLMSDRYHPSLDENLRLSVAMGEDSRADYEAELAHRAVLRGAVLKAMAEHELDALLYPTLRQKAAPLGEVQLGGNCQLSANTGLPAVTVPAGFTADGLPVGLELLGRRWSERDLLAMAYAFEQGTRHRRPPELSAEEQ